MDGPSGIDALLIGGEHGDVPLDPHGGAELAEVIVEGDINCVISMVQMNYTEQQRFGADFLEQLFLLNRTPRFVVWEEAHNFLPQNLKFEEQKRVLYACEKIVQEGRGKGLGFAVVSQRPAVVNKNILEQVDNFVALGMIGPNDLQQVENWFRHQIRVSDPKERERKLNDLISDIAQMEVGHAWFLSPVWMHRLERLRFRMRATYHAGRTPVPGEKPVNLKALSVSEAVEKLKERFAVRTAAHKKEVVDLKEAKARIRELEKQIRISASPAIPQKQDMRALDAAISEAGAQRSYGQEMRQYALYLEKCLTRLRNAFEKESTSIGGILNGMTIDNVKMPTQPHSRYVERFPGHVGIRPVVADSAPKARPRKEISIASNGETELAKADKAILKALAQLLSIGKKHPTRGEVAGWSGYPVNSGGFKNPMGKLRSAGLIDYPSEGLVLLTAKGDSVVGTVDAPTNNELEDLALSVCAGIAEEKIVSALIEARGPVSREWLSNKTGYPVDSGGFKNPLGSLRSKGVIEYPQQGAVKVSSWVLGE